MQDLWWLHPKRDTPGDPIFAAQVESEKKRKFDYLKFEQDKREFEQLLPVKLESERTLQKYRQAEIDNFVVKNKQAQQNLDDSQADQQVLANWIEGLNQLEPAERGNALPPKLKTPKAMNDALDIILRQQHTWDFLRKKEGLVKDRQLGVAEVKQEGAEVLEGMRGETRRDVAEIGAESRRDVAGIGARSRETVADKNAASRKEVAELKFKQAQGAGGLLAPAIRATYLRELNAAERAPGGFDSKIARIQAVAKKYGLEGKLTFDDTPLTTDAPPAPAKAEPPATPTVPRFKFTPGKGIQ